MTPAPTTARLGAVMGVVGLLATVAAALGIGVLALDGSKAHAAVDEPQYLSSALSLAEDGDLDIADELADDRAAAYHPAPLPVQTRVQADGSQVSPHDPLLSVLLAPAVALGGWVGAKLVLAGLAGVLAALLVWLAVRRFAVPLPVAGGVVVVAATSAPLAVYGQQVYPELPAALAVAVATATLTGRLGGAAVVTLVLAVVALPWLSVKYAPIAAVLALLGLVALWRAGQHRVAAGALAVLGMAGIAFLVLHRVLYGGWTAYAAGDHFQVSGELSVVGVDPDYAGRSTRLLGLLVDRDFGLVAWQPAWLLVLPATAALPWLLPRTGTGAGAGAVAGTGAGAGVRSGLPGWIVLLAPLAAGWLVASFVALTMHGYWWPGRQVVVVLPLAVLAVAVWLGHLHRTAESMLRWLLLGAAGLLAAIGTAVYAWVLVAGRSGRLSWVGAPDEPVPAVLAGLRAALPDYRILSTQTWWLHAAWALVCVLLIAGGVRSARPPARASAGSRADITHGRTDTRTDSRGESRTDSRTDSRAESRTDSRADSRADVRTLQPTGPRNR